MIFQNLNIFSFLTLLSIIVGIIFLLYTFAAHHKKVVGKYSLLMQGNTIKQQLFYVGIAIILLSISILKPSIETFSENIEVDGLDVMVILDVSKSMLAEDIGDSKGEYSRINAAKSLLGKIVVQNPENRYGLVVFAGEAVNVSPLTSDSQIFLNFLSGVDYRNVNEQGTDLLAAYSRGLDRFIDDENNGKAIILLSDGGDEEDTINTKEIRALLRDSGVHQTIIGIGTTAGAKIIKGRDIFGEINYEQYNGKDVVTQLNQESLEDLANLEGGEYYEISQLADIESVSNIFSEIEKKSIEKSGGKNILDIARYISFFVFVIFLYFLCIPFIHKKAKR